MESEPCTSSGLRLGLVKIVKKMEWFKEKVPHVQGHAAFKNCFGKRPVHAQRAPALELSADSRLPLPPACLRRMFLLSDEVTIEGPA